MNNTQLQAHSSASHNAAVRLRRAHESFHGDAPRTGRGGDGARRNRPLWSFLRRSNPGKPAARVSRSRSRPRALSRVSSTVTHDSAGDVSVRGLRCGHADQAGRRDPVPRVRVSYPVQEADNARGAIRGSLGCVKVWKISEVVVGTRTRTRTGGQEPMKTPITYSHNGLLSVGHDPREAENVIYIFADRFLPPFRLVSSRLFSSLDSTRTTGRPIRSDRSDPTDQIRPISSDALTQLSRPNRRTQPQDPTAGPNRRTSDLGPRRSWTPHAL